MPSLPGPRGPIAFERDSLGYPSVRARDLHEGTFALGYLHANDRLVQITLSGLAARGELIAGGAIDGGNGGALLLFKGDSPAAAEAFAKEDPYVRHGVVTEWAVKQWTTVVGPIAEQPA